MNNRLSRLMAQFRPSPAPQPRTDARTPLTALDWIVIGICAGTAVVGIVRAVLLIGGVL